MTADRTSISSTFRALPLARLGPCNPWPRFRFQIPSAPILAPDSLDDEERAGLFTDAAVPPLPYLMQDQYTRRRERGRLPVIRIENRALRAMFYPSLGGRMISLYDKRRGRELLFDNPVFQPANLAIRNAWFSGGVEWNGPLYGHSLLTCSSVFAGAVETPRGPLLRLYEFDRALETTWQVDVLLPARDDRLWIHVKAINPNAHDISFYWWTNIAAPLPGDTRVLSPADYALTHGPAGNTRVTFPERDGFDGSYPARYPYSCSVFFRKPGTARPWSVYVDRRGRGLSHVSTATLSGRKMFTWGSGRGGKRWMDFLSARGQGCYIEMQGGNTPTQLQARPLKAGASVEWTECMSPFAMDAKSAHHRDYHAACTFAGTILDARVPADELRDMNAFLSAHADAPIKAVIHRGSAWGRLHEQRTGRRLSPGLEFEYEPGNEERPWAELLSAGRFSADTLSKRPLSFNVSPGWAATLRRSARAYGSTWLHHLHLGVLRLEAGAFKAARAHLLASLALQENAPAHRNLALLHERAGRVRAAQVAYERAWSLAGNDRNLAAEIGAFLARHKRGRALSAFVKSLPATVARHEPIRLLAARMALEAGRYRSVRRMLQREFCAVREGELSLTDLWFASHVGESEKRKGRALTVGEKEALMRRFPPPRRIDFRMK